MADKKPNIHKTILILFLVFIPPYWLVFTDEGSRVSDTALLWLLGQDEIRVNFSELDSSFTERDIQAVYSDNEWRCGAKQTQFGDAVCAAKIGAFNGFPARLLTFYFGDQRVSALKLIYRTSYHQQIMGYLIGEFGQPANVAEAIADGPDADTVLEWDLDRGVLLMKKTLAKTDEPSLLWLAGKAGPD